MASFLVGGPVGEPESTRAAGCLVFCLSRRLVLLCRFTENRLCNILRIMLGVQHTRGSGRGSGTCDRGQACVPAPGLSARLPSLLLPQLRLLQGLAPCGAPLPPLSYHMSGVVFYEKGSVRPQVH